METVKKFLECRRKRDSEGAIALIEPNITLGSPWGYRYGEDEAKEFLTDEKNFNYRSYVDREYKLEEVAPNVFQRKFEYDKGIHQMEHQRSHYFTGWLAFIPLQRRCSYYRECYWVKDDKIRMVTCFMQP